MPTRPLGLPVNGLTRRSYSGINILLLWSALEERGFGSPYWVTFKQCIAMGGSVRKVEKGTYVYFADKFVPQKEKARAEQALREALESEHVAAAAFDDPAGKVGGREIGRAGQDRPGAERVIKHDRIAFGRHRLIDGQGDGGGKMPVDGGAVGFAGVRRRLEPEKVCEQPDRALSSPRSAIRSRWPRKRRRQASMPSPFT
ncbi:MAG: ArdC family protein [Akkermansiaceae bacterium]|nr:ArdC family protein [Akkermansiaceae bacterium]